jgi:RNA polymerase sigma factor (sigma-70 family)
VLKPDSGNWDRKSSQVNRPSFHQAGGNAMTRTAEMPVEQVATQGSSKWTDARLVRECLDGNQEAWSALIQKYKNLIFSVPIKYGFNREDASDIFQSVCVELLAQLPKLREPRALPKWILMVASHTCYHRKHKDQKNQMKADEMTRWFEEALPAEAEEIVQKAEREQALRTAVSELPPQCQQLVRMLFFESSARPYDEVAKELSLATGSIGLTRQRCLSRLRRKLSDAHIS